MPPASTHRGLLTAHAPGSARPGPQSRVSRHPGQKHAMPFIMDSHFCRASRNRGKKRSPRHPSVPRRRSTFLERELGIAKEEWPFLDGFGLGSSVVLLRGLEIWELCEFPSEPSPVLHTLRSWTGASRPLHHTTPGIVVPVSMPGGSQVTPHGHLCPLAPPTSSLYNSFCLFT